ncbi:MAG: hypothetical protein HONBIEJF_02904 [Fimbriimonadaceae bacterium]|nr:hypothetical protein [Fimbriimonadaceae bacterium]
MVFFALAIGQNSAFSEVERAQILSFWAEPQRYIVERVSADGKTPRYQVRLSIEGSKWLLEFRKATGQGKNTTLDFVPPDPEMLAEWNAWINSRIHWDRHLQFLAATEKAAAERETPPVDEYPTDPVDPGPQPESLVAFAGESPSFATIVEPNRYKVTFDDKRTWIYEDNIKAPHNYAYYRFPSGVIRGGTPVKKLPESELNRLAKVAGIDERSFRIMKSVSLLEGGFDSVNTYDTGFVSVGFIQFACLSAGAGSLGQVLQAMKSADPIAYQSYFRRYGLDVSADGNLVAVDLKTGDERVGPDAAMAIIEDKRLIAAFERAGAECGSFRIAQLRIAYQRYFPSDVLTINIAGKATQVPVEKLFKSEAALATFMDRKVHTGKIGPLRERVQAVFDQNGLTSIAEFADHERDVVAAMRHRKDFLSDAMLTQPRLISDIASRKGTRTKPPLKAADKPKQPAKAVPKPKTADKKPPEKKLTNPADDTTRKAVSDG